MSIHITDKEMTSDRTRHTAGQVTDADGKPVTVEMSDGGHGSGWRVSWLPGRTLDRNQAITAMVLAETVSAGIGDHTDPIWPHLDAWAAELGLSGPDAVGKISYYETGQPDTRLIPEDPQSVRIDGRA